MPRLAGLGVRGAALLLDLICALALTLLLSSTSGRFFSGRAVALLRIGDPGSFWKGPIPMLLGAMGTLTFGFPLAALMVLLPEGIFGMSPGKMIVGIRVRRADGSAPGLKTLVLRLAIKGCGLWLGILALLSSYLILAIIGLGVQLLLLLGWFLALGPRGAALHDRFAGCTGLFTLPSK